jgi:hypothetical protein
VNIHVGNTLLECFRNGTVIEVREVSLDGAKAKKQETVSMLNRVLSSVYHCRAELDCLELLLSEA